MISFQFCMTMRVDITVVLVVAGGSVTQEIVHSGVVVVKILRVYDVEDRFHPLIRVPLHLALFAVRIARKYFSNL